MHSIGASYLCEWSIAVIERAKMVEPSPEITVNDTDLKLEKKMRVIHKKAGSISEPVLKKEGTIKVAKA